MGGFGRTCQRTVHDLSILHGVYNAEKICWVLVGFWLVLVVSSFGSLGWGQVNNNQVSFEAVRVFFRMYQISI